MRNKKTIDESLHRLRMLQDVVGVYEEIAAKRMQKIRNSVLLNRQFLDGVSLVFSTVKLSYKHEVERLTKQKQKHDASLTFTATNGKTVCVLLSANTGLYGSIIKDTFDVFLQTVTATASDVVIIGKLGISYFQNTTKNRDFTAFDLPDGIVEPGTLDNIILHLLRYEKIIVFHGSFQSIVSQIPTQSPISGDIPQTTPSGEQIKYLFEPSLKTIMTTFEQEIFASLFEQSVHESQLSKFASRMVLLDQALENIKKDLSKTLFEEKNLKHKLANAKQQTVLSGRSLWK